MKKFETKSLYVIKVHANESEIYIICRYSAFKNSYREIFTNEKININDKESIQPLSNFYYLFLKDNTSYLNPTTLDKKELLNFYVAINNESALINQEKELNENKNMIEPNGILERATANFFPKKGDWYSSCFNRPNSFVMSNLPCHLRDDLWLAEMLKQNQNLIFVSSSRILNFVKTSPFFDLKRREYEQEIVKWQINWMRNGGENWIVSPEYGGDFFVFSSECDLGFRKGIVDTLSAIGMDIEAIEEGIEKNADLWRNLYMKNAFRNEYDSVFLDLHFDIGSVFGDSKKSPDEDQNKIILEPINPEFMDNWLRMRKYEYYQRHKDSVDKYGIVDDDMIMSDEEVTELQKYLREQDSIRRAQIEEFENQKKNKQRKL